MWLEVEALPGCVHTWIWVGGEVGDDDLGDE